MLQSSNYLWRWYLRYLNIITGLLSQLERGEKHPRGASLKLLTLVAKKGLAAVA